MKLNYFAVLVLIILLIETSNAFSSGAPSDTCSTMQPSHGANVPSDCGPNCPFNIVVTNIGGQPVQGIVDYRCGQVHTSK